MDAPSGPKTSRPSLTGRQVVVVDDDPQLLKILTDILQEEGCIVTAFDRFQDAKKHLGTGARPDILITDVRLGAFNGMQLAVMSKLDRPDLIAVVMTGFDDPVLRKDADAAGAHYLLKPVSATQLVDYLLERLER